MILWHKNSLDSDLILQQKKAIYKLINEIFNSLNNKFIVGGILFDLEKAFDCLNHDVLLSKLQFYGINGKSRL